MFAQLNPSLPVEVLPRPGSQIPRGRAQAIGVIDYGPEHHLHWVVFMDTSRECWVVPNPEIRAQANYTMGRS